METPPLHASLIKDDLNVIIEFEMSKVRKRLEEKGMHLVLEQTAKDFLIDKGYNPDFGARPLRRAIGQYVEDSLAEQLLSGEFMAGDTVTLTRKPDQEHLTFVTDRPKPAEAPPADSSSEAPPPATASAS